MQKFLKESLNLLRKSLHTTHLPLLLNLDKLTFTPRLLPNQTNMKYETQLRSYIY